MERPHYTYFNTKWQGLRLLLPQIHLTLWWHYALAVVGVFGMSLLQQLCEQAYCEHEQRLREAGPSYDALEWSQQAVRAALMAPRVLLATLIILVVVTMDVGLVVACCAGSVVGFFLLRRTFAVLSDSHKKPNKGSLV